MEEETGDNAPVVFVEQPVDDECQHEGADKEVCRVEPAGEEGVMIEIADKEERRVPERPEEAKRERGYKQRGPAPEAVNPVSSPPRLLKGRGNEETDESGQGQKGRAEQDRKLVRRFPEDDESCNKGDRTARGTSAILAVLQCPRDN